MRDDDDRRPPMAAGKRTDSCLSQTTVRRRRRSQIFADDRRLLPVKTAPMAVRFPNGSVKEVDVVECRLRTEILLYWSCLGPQGRKNQAFGFEDCNCVMARVRLKQKE